MFKISLQKKSIGKQCCAYNCTNKPVERKGGLCHKHYARKLREEDPVSVRFSQMKQKAKSRNIEFTLNIVWFRKFCERTGYIVVKGRRGQNATVDRLCNLHGYHCWNVGIKTNRQNASKGNRHAGSNFERPKGKFEDLPF